MSNIQWDRSKKSNNDGVEKKVTVGHGVTFSGEITGADEVSIDGTGDIKLETTKLVVGPGGLLKGNITCSDADIGGQLEGKIEVTNTLAIQENGSVRGEINYKQLRVALGGQLAGDLQATKIAEVKPQSNTDSGYLSEMISPAKARNS